MMGQSAGLRETQECGAIERRARVERALGYAALLVDRQGEAFLPIFLRLETELAAMTQQADALDRARARAAQMAMR